MSLEGIGPEDLEGLPGIESLPEPGFDFLFGMSLSVEEPEHIGPTQSGQRRIVGVSGGAFAGPRLRGRVLPGGSDWITIRPDGVLVQDVRLILRLEAGGDVLMTYRGLRDGPEPVMRRVNAGEDPDPAEYYFRTQPIFEAPDGDYEWLNRLVAVAVGRRLEDGVIYAVYAIS